MKSTEIKTGDEILVKDFNDIATVTDVKTADGRTIYTVTMEVPQQFAHKVESWTENFIDGDTKEVIPVKRYNVIY